MTTTEEDHRHLSKSQDHSPHILSLFLSLSHTYRILLKRLPENLKEWHEGSKNVPSSFSTFIQIHFQTYSCPLGQQVCCSLHHPVPCITITFIKQIICLPPLAYQSHQNSFCYLPFVQFPSASTLGLMYSNTQLTSISSIFL